MPPESQDIGPIILDSSSRFFPLYLSASYQAGIKNGWGNEACKLPYKYMSISIIHRITLIITCSQVFTGM